MKPDVEIKSGQAQDKALETIWRTRLQKARPDSPERQWAEWQTRYYEAKTSASPTPGNSSDYVGTYGDNRHVLLAGNRLFLQSGSGAPNPLLPLSDGSFAVEGANYYGVGSNRVRFVRSDGGAVTGIQQLVRHQPFQVATFDYTRK